MNVLSLFDGISCGYIALERADINVDKYVAYEIDENAIKISKYNYPNIEHKGDVTKTDFTQYKGFDLLIGGSPCTYWSIARAGNGRGRETTSSGIGYNLFCQFVKALKEVKPKYFLYENNASISPNIKKEISKELGVECVTINSKLLSAQSRNRCYWTNIPFDMPKDLGIKLNDIVDFSTHDFRPIGKWCLQYWGDKRKIDSLKTVNSEKSHTLTTSKTHPMNYYLNEDKTEYCNLTVNDFEKLQTLPLDYVNAVPITQGNKYKAIGNGWTVDVIAHILKGIRKEI